VPCGTQPLPNTYVIADPPQVRHSRGMANPKNDFEQAAQIVEAFAEAETDR
jgi:hypothetical protein